MIIPCIQNSCIQNPCIQNPCIQNPCIQNPKTCIQNCLQPRSWNCTQNCIFEEILETVTPFPEICIKYHETCTHFPEACIHFPETSAKCILYICTLICAFTRAPVRNFRRLELGHTFFRQSRCTFRS